MSYRFDRDNYPTIIPECVIVDKRLSLKAKGMYLFLMHRIDPEYPYGSREEIMESSSDGVGSISTALKELEDVGLLTRRRVRGGKVEYKLANDGSNDYNWLVLQKMEEEEDEQTH